MLARPTALSRRRKSSSSRSLATTSRRSAAIERSSRGRICRIRIVSVVAERWSRLRSMRNRVARAISVARSRSLGSLATPSPWRTSRSSEVLGRVQLIEQSANARPDFRGRVSRFDVRVEIADHFDVQLLVKIELAARLRGALDHARDGVHAPQVEPGLRRSRDEHDDERRPDPRAQAGLRPQARQARVGPRARAEIPFTTRADNRYTRP